MTENKDAGELGRENQLAEDIQPFEKIEQFLLKEVLADNAGGPAGCLGVGILGGGVLYFVEKIKNGETMSIADWLIFGIIATMAGGAGKIMQKRIAGAKERAREKASEFALYCSSLFEDDDFFGEECSREVVQAFRKWVVRSAGFEWFLRTYYCTGFNMDAVKWEALFEIPNFGHKDICGPGAIKKLCEHENFQQFAVLFASFPSSGRDFFDVFQEKLGEIYLSDTSS